MDKVVQQNAANAEESASASEQMNAQAEQLRDFSGKLVALVSGQRDAVPGIEMKGGSQPGTRALPRSTPPSEPRKNEVRPDQVIPLDDDDGFQDF